jgi:hypothetical protein
MRHTLVILYFVAVYYILRPAPPPEIQNNAPPEPSASRPETPQPTATVAPPKRNWEVPSRATPDPLVPAASPDTSLPATTSSSSAASPSSPAKSIVQTLETPAEPRASSPVTAEPEEGPVEALLQKELARLSCLIGKPEKVWGKKSRAALRRFARRAKVENSNRDAALLRMMRAYPANYCKSCRPGQAACDVPVNDGAPKTAGDATAADRGGQGLNAATAPVVPAPAGETPETAATSYLPPWMIEDGATDAEEKTRASEETRPSRKRKKAKRRRPSRSVNSPRRRYGAPSPYYRGGGWPFGY